MSGKVFAHLPLSDGASVNDSLTQVGFRRSQNIAYRPACEACTACVSARIPASDYIFSRSERRAIVRNEDLERHLVEAEATMEQFDLLRRYLTTRHADGGMAEMTWPDYVAMVEDTAVRTHIIEYRTRAKDRGPGDLVACVLVDVMSDGLSLVYSFYDPTQSRRSLGSFVILDHVVQACLTDLPYVYLGYWVRAAPRRWTTRSASRQSNSSSPRVGRLSSTAQPRQPTRRSRTIGEHGPAASAEPS